MENIATREPCTLVRTLTRVAGGQSVMDNTQKHNILSRYCPHCVCVRLNHFFSHLVGWRFALYLEQTCGSGQEQVKTLGAMVLIPRSLARS